jgi:hypothetical protein
MNGAQVGIFEELGQEGFGCFLQAHNYGHTTIWSICIHAQCMHAKMIGSPVRPTTQMIAFAGQVRFVELFP